MIAKAAQTKCETIVLGDEPTTDGLRKFRMDLKEAAANALQSDPNYAYRCVRSVEDAIAIEDLAGELKYPAFESELNISISKCEEIYIIAEQVQPQARKVANRGEGKNQGSSVTLAGV